MFSPHLSRSPIWGPIIPHLSRPPLNLKQHPSCPSDIVLGDFHILLTDHLARIDRLADKKLLLFYHGSGWADFQAEIQRTFSGDGLSVIPVLQARELPQLLTAVMRGADEAEHAVRERAGKQKDIGVGVGVGVLAGMGISEHAVLMIHGMFRDLPTFARTAERKELEVLGREEAERVLEFFEEEWVVGG